MLKKILAITGKPGLFRIVSQGNRMLLVEDLASAKRFPAHSRDKILSLGDIAMYTDRGDIPLGEILDALYASRKGEKIDIKQAIADGKLRDIFAEAVPDFDRDRVYDSDIKKLFTWYNILVENGFTRFAEEEEKEKNTEE